MHRRPRQKSKLPTGKENSGSKHSRENCPAKYSSPGLAFFSKESTAEDIRFVLRDEYALSKYSSPESTSFCEVKTESSTYNQSSLSLDEYAFAQYLFLEWPFFYQAMIDEQIFECNQADEHTSLAGVESHHSQNLQKSAPTMERFHTNAKFLKSLSPMLHRIYENNQKRGVPLKVVEKIEGGKTTSVSVRWSFE